jgi:hypothetical protein
MPFSCTDRYVSRIAALARDVLIGRNFCISAIIPEFETELLLFRLRTMAAIRFMRFGDKGDES